MKKAFKSIVVGQTSISMIQTGSKVFMPSEISFSEKYPTLGNDLQREFFHATPMIGQIGSCNLLSNGSHDVSVILIDATGNPIPSEDGSPFKLDVFNVNPRTEIGMGQWCDNEEAVNTLCIKKNKRNNAGMAKLIDELQACINYNATASRLVEKSINSNSSSQETEMRASMEGVFIGPLQKESPKECVKEAPFFKDED